MFWRASLASTSCIWSLKRTPEVLSTLSVASRYPPHPCHVMSPFGLPCHHLLCHVMSLTYGLPCRYVFCCASCVLPAVRCFAMSSCVLPCHHVLCQVIHLFCDAMCSAICRHLFCHNIMCVTMSSCVIPCLVCVAMSSCFHHAMWLNTCTCATLLDA